MLIQRYTGMAQALHWLTAAALCLLLPFVWVAENFPPGPVRAGWYLAHESMGMSVWLLVLLRLTWRWRHRAPRYPSQVNAWQRWVAHLNHGLLYGVLLVMPVTGYMMAGNGQPVPYFGVVDWPALPKNEAMGLLGNRIHVAGQFALYALLGLHLAATVWHVAVRRDGMLERMLPEQRPPTDGRSP